MFQKHPGATYVQEINLVRLNGNNAAHGKSVNQNESLVSLKGLFRFLSFISRYYSEENPAIPAFDESLIPDGKKNEKNTQGTESQSG